MISRINLNKFDKNIKTCIEIASCIGIIMGIILGLTLLGCIFNETSDEATIKEVIMVMLIIGVGMSFILTMMIPDTTKEALIFITVLLLSFLIVFGMAGIFLISLPWYWIVGLIVIIIILMELLFNGKGYKGRTKKDKFWFTAGRKVESLIESLAIVINAFNIKYIFVEYNLLGKLYELLSKLPYKIIIQWIGYIAVGIIALAVLIGILYLWIKLNELRVKR